MKTRAPRRAATSWAWGLLALGLGAFHAATLRTFPMVDMDEAMEANHSFNVLARGQNVYSLYEGLFPRRFAFMEHGLPNTLRPFFNMGLAAAFRLGGVSPWSGRAYSLFCALAALALLTWLARRWTRSHAAALAFAAALGLDMVFTFSAHEIRPEAMLLFFSSLCLAGFEWAETRPEALIGVGLLAALAPGIHTNGGAVAVASTAVLFLRRPRAWPYFFFGATLGLCATLSFVHPERFLPSWIVFQGFFSYYPPFHNLGANLPAMIAAECGRYWNPPFLGYIPVGPTLAWSLRLKWAALAGLWIAALKLYAREKDRRVLSLAVWVGLQGLFYSIFVANKNPNYASVFEPFALLLAAVVLARAAREHLSRWSIPRLLWAGLSGLAILGAGAAAGAGLFAALLLVLPAAKPARRVEDLLLPLLAALVPIFCVRVYAPWTFDAVADAAVHALSGPAGLIALAGAAAAAALIRRTPARERPRAVAGWAAAGLTLALASSAAVDAAMIARAARRTVDYDTIAARVRALVPPGARVIGPQLMWFAFQDRPYRDFDGLSYAKWLTGDGDVTRYARRWRPDYLITDCRFPDIFLKRRTLAQTLTVPLTEVGRVDDGREYCHPLVVYRFDRASSL